MRSISESMIVTRSLSSALIVLSLVFACARIGSAAPPDETADAQTLTPLLLAMPDAPVPFMGSDGHIHLVYELWLTNFSSGKADIQRVRIFGDGKLLKILATPDIDQRLVSAGTRQPNQGVMEHSAQALLFTHVTLPIGVKVPERLAHRVTARFAAAPPGKEEVTAILDSSPVDRQSVVTIGPPLRGARYISADSCCDATRHTRAALPVNGRVWVAQRYAVDWEQLDDHNRIYNGPREALTSYTIYGQKVYAVADGTVVVAINDQPEQVPGRFPTHMTVGQADGNAVVLDLGAGAWALYAHMQTGSVRVHPGERVVRGKVIGLVGNSGNTIAPHLHFQVMNGPLSLGSNGLPYVIDAYQIIGISPGTEAFDKAEADGTPLGVKPVSRPQQVTKALPLDQLIVAFSPQISR